MADATAEILGLLRGPGCMFCEEEGRQLQNFYFWYLAEQYFEPYSIEHMQRSAGFCRRHTARFLALAPSSTVARVYVWMLPPYLERLRALEAAPFGRHAACVEALHPTAGCSACLLERDGCRSRQLRLSAALQDADVQAALERSAAVCLEHFLGLAWTLGWTDLRSATRGQLAVWPKAGLAPPLARLKGTDLDASLRRRPEEPAAEPSRPWMAGAGAAEDGPWQAWSPTLEALRQLLGRPVCPVCEMRHRALHQYFGWLEQEISAQSLSRWQDAVWLCRLHAWDFATGWGPAAVRKLSDATAKHWHAQLTRLAQTLDQPPPANPLARMRGWHSPGQLRAALAAALRRPSTVLAELRERLLRRHECPACRAAGTAARRMTELVAVGLGDAETRNAYERSSGLCYRHLPLACEAVRDGQQLRTLAATQRARLEVLQWELDEALRKESWSARHEERRAETSAWRRAAAQISGSGLNGGLLGA
jgi:hypothetical protein